jgi:hypothetical protein
MTRLTLFLLIVVCGITASLLTGSPGASADDDHVFLAIDTNVAGNDDNRLGLTESCTETPLKIGDTIDVDVIVRGVPAYVEHGPGGRPSGGIEAYEFDLRYDPALLRLHRIDLEDTPNIFRTSGNQSLAYYVDYGPESGLQYDPVKVSGNINIYMGDVRTSDLESGNGVLARVTFTGISSGVSRLQVNKQVVYSAGLNYYRTQAMSSSIIVDTGTCLEATLSTLSSPQPTVASLPRQGGPPDIAGTSRWHALALMLGGLVLAGGGFALARRRLQ